MAYLAGAFFLFALGARAGRWFAGAAVLLALAAAARALMGYPALTVTLCAVAGGAAFLLPRQRTPVSAAALMLGTVLAAYAVFGPADGLL
ncbi:MAG: hypothetical protein E6G94_03875 [Alphaproteobacteria bacterium]|nr:MAG: hypothetical protein E6G94_03875 [Alphaproteobacteria bacterium]